MLSQQLRLSIIMDSKGVKSSCSHLKTKNEFVAKMDEIKQEKASIEQSILALDDDITEIEEFVFDYDSDIPEVVSEPIQSKEWDLRDERHELYNQLETLNEKLTEQQEEIVEIETYAKKAHCFCMSKKKKLKE